MKSPLTPSIRFNSLNHLRKKIKPNSKIRTLFLYDANLELSLSKLDHTILAHTNKSYIFEFWHTVLTEPRKLQELTKHYMQFIDDGQLYSFQKDWFTNRNKLIRSMLFYILSNCSDSNLASCGKINKNKLTSYMMSRLSTFKPKNFFPFYSDSDNPLESLNNTGDVDYIILPVGNYSLNLFEGGKNKGPEMYTFHHKSIHSRFSDLEKKCIVLYKRHPALFSLYASFNIEMIDKYGRLTSDRKACEELIIANF
tara:strand:- start:513 stop:1271 length:759 start_codon:yes stop_codon:yes gene_type:complete